ncbi:thiamine pyrophosphate-binding protein, partial [Rhodococcus sp. CX]|uniref:thiamine pyrophosphate-binding protein n=1 Tax=Rhodococcus sp. CX TaxID=2789880 RepID=UPI0022B16C94
MAPETERHGEIEGHGGDLAAAVAHAHGVRTMFTLSGAHVFPLYDAVVKGESPMRLIDVRHEQTAVFAAEATGKLERHPGLAVLTAGPGVTNGISAVTQAHFSGSPLVVLGGRAPNARWGTGSLQELDQPPLLHTVTKLSETARTVDRIVPTVDAAFTAAGSSHRGPAFVDFPMDELFGRTTTKIASPQHVRLDPDPDSLAEIAVL